MNVQVGHSRSPTSATAKPFRPRPNLPSSRPRVQRFYALHVGGLNARGDREFVAECRRPSFVCADGGSVVLLGRLAGAGRIQQVPTTDAGWDVLRAVGERLGARPGSRWSAEPRSWWPERPEASPRARPERWCWLRTATTMSWADVLAAIVAAAPDVLVLGLGAPKEMLWVREHADRLPPCLVMTCGGWFGFLSGAEKRAPELLRRPGLEWLARVSQPRPTGTALPSGCVHGGGAGGRNDPAAGSARDRLRTPFLRHARRGVRGRRGFDPRPVAATGCAAPR